MNLQLLKDVVDVLVWISGFVTWFVFIPQLKLLYKVKESKSISSLTMWMSWSIQVVILSQALLAGNTSLIFTMLVSVFFISIVIVFVHYYRAFPGGR